MGAARCLCKSVLNCQSDPQILITIVSAVNPDRLLASVNLLVCGPPLISQSQQLPPPMSPCQGLWEVLDLVKPQG